MHNLLEPKALHESEQARSVVGATLSQENFDVGTTPGQSIKDAPISFSIPCAGAGNDQTLVSSPHPGWTGNAIQGSNLTGSSPSVRFKKQIPGMVRGAQSGRWTFKCRAWFNQEESNFVGFGFSPLTSTRRNPFAVSFIHGHWLAAR